MRKALAARYLDALHWAALIEREAGTTNSSASQLAKIEEHFSDINYS